MEKAKGKYRDIKFFSEKNKAIMCVHCKTARDYAEWIEHQAYVDSYEVNVPLESERMVSVSSVGIRSLYFKTDWASDFLLHFSDGSKGVRELTSMNDLKKEANIERLELSRRYWKALGIQNWKLVLPAQEY